MNWYKKAQQNYFSPIEKSIAKLIVDRYRGNNFNFNEVNQITSYFTDEFSMANYLQKAISLASTGLNIQPTDPSLTAIVNEINQLFGTEMKKKEQVDNEIGLPKTQTDDQIANDTTQSNENSLNQISE